MHAVESVPELPHQRQRLESKLRSAEALPERPRSAALEALKSMPTGERLCHGDLHPGNVLLTAHGDIIIDWIGATRGSPLADVARTSVMSLGAAASDQIPHPLMKAFVRIFDAIYQRAYFHLRPGGQREYRRWMPIMAAARLNEAIPELEAWLIRQAEKIDTREYGFKG
jgi:aminoglycoside phosphotransferase (APT) family kinase protein